jgi:hypothetical protein
MLNAKPLPKTHRLLEGKSMTIAAGYVCPEGVVLCADTEELRGEYKFRTPKLIVLPESEDATRIKVVFAGAGDGYFIDKLVAEMWKAALHSSGGIDQAVDAMEDAILRIHQKFWPVYPAAERPQADLLFAALVGGEIRLYKATGPIVNEVEGYELTGIGDVLARYIAARTYKDNLSLQEAAVLATYTLEQAKEYVDGCGGESHVVLLFKTGKHRRLDFMKITALNTMLRSYEQSAMQLMLAAPNQEISDADFDVRVETFRLILKALRRTSAKSMDILTKMLEEIVTAATQSDVQKSEGQK